MAALIRFFFFTKFENLSWTEEFVVKCKFANFDEIYASL